MKRYGYLFDKAFSKENIELAIIKAAKGKRNRKNVMHILMHKDEYVEKIYNMMWNDEFVPSPYTKAIIQDGISHKTRELCKPKFYPDHIVEWCIYLVLEPILKKTMIKNTYASLKGRGQMYGLKKCKKAIKSKNAKYYYKCDIRKFYPSVNNEILLEMLEHKIKDKRFLMLIKSILDLVKGLPIGMILSQLFSNFYLNDVDHTMESHNYRRYADDIVIFAKNSRLAHEKRIILENLISRKFLTIKHTWFVFKTSKCALDFMGFRIYKDYVTIRKSILYRITKKITRWIYNHSLKNAQAITSYMGWVKNTNSYQFYQDEISLFVNFKQLKDIIRKGEKKNENLCFAI